MDRTAGTKDLGTRMLGKASWDRTAEIGQPGQDSQERTAGEGSQDFIGQDRQDKKKRTGRPHYVSKDRTAGTGQRGRTTVLRQP
jgi:hypothetical protein